MKKLLILLFMGLSTMILNAQTETTPLEGKVVIEVDGLACPFCAYGLEKNLKQIEGVESIAINIDEGSVLLGIADGIQISESVVSEKDKSSGFYSRNH
ncbi:heavy-metal-associated domain-containing protein [uncultured Maribacter sp.]|uniref:heavy-metal-associated domain-containing protein n=1 Tax=uncultured Maribacter sp. TaxID=431308 RepID=UPI0030EB9EDB|tara:strand:- start:46167 stop:46460 length:294 start_codon:yes stop_codon:yes gene_type:complete